MNIFSLLIGLVYGYRLSILHTNDVHSHYDESNKYGTDCNSKQISDGQCYGGLARLKTAIDEQRRLHKNTLLFDAGDQFQGTLFYTYYKGNVTSDAMNLLGYDLMTLGNHEFDHGPENVARVASSFNFPLVSSNINASQVPCLSKIVKPFHLFPEHKLAVVGYITKTAPFISTLGKVQVEDPIVAIQRTVDEVKQLGYTRVIAVSHNGYNEDKELAKKVKGLSLIVGGHSHSYLAPTDNPSKDLKSIGVYPTKVDNPKGKKVYVVQAYCWSRFLGHIDIEFGQDGYLTRIEGAPIELNSNVKMDPATHAKVQSIRKPFDDYANQIIGETLVDLDQTKCQSQECTMGSLITDVMLDYRPQADMAFINAGGIRASIPQGNITLGNVITVLPFSNAITEFSLNGTQIWNLLESSVSKSNPVNNKPVTSFIQLAGIRFKFDPSQPKLHQIHNVEFLNRSANQYTSLIHSNTYTVVTIDFLATGGDNLLAPPIAGSPTLEATDEVVARYIQTHSPINITVGYRITMAKKSNCNQTPTYSSTATTKTNASNSSFHIYGGIGLILSILSTFIVLIVFD